MELVIQKAVELGVSEIIPVAMKNCVVKVDGARAEAKRAIAARNYNLITLNLLRFYKKLKHLSAPVLCSGANAHPFALTADFQNQEGQIFLSILGQAQGTEPELKVTLFQGLPKGDKMELVIQKAVELGELP